MALAPAESEAAHRCFGKRATVVGTKKGERLRGTRRADVIWGGGGRDVIRGLGGKDRLCGVVGNDRLLGAAGGDRLDGGAGRDTLVGGDGSDKLTGGKGTDTCNIGSETTLAFTSCERFPLTVTGKVTLDTGGGANGSRVKVSAANGLGSPIVNANAAGTYKANLTATKLPTDLTAQISFSPAGLPSVGSARETRARSNTPGLATAVVPNVAAAELTLAAGSAESPDGATQISGAPGEIDRIFARSYSPSANAAAFPGTFEEQGEVPLNSSLFVWIAALDSSGNSLHQLSGPMTIRSLVTSSQLKDLVDLTTGTDRIEIPIFTFDETTNMWKDDGTGWLEDAAGGLIPEDAQAELISGDFPGQVFSRMETSHLSFVNVDYPYFGPWDVSSVGPDKRTDQCLGEALDLANVILRSQQAHEPLLQVNAPGADLAKELANGAIKLKVAYPPPDVGDFSYGWTDINDPAVPIYLNQNYTDYCAPGAPLSIKGQNAMVLILAATIVHEVGHWKWYVKHEAGDQDEGEPSGEAGWHVESYLFPEGPLELGLDAPNGKPIGVIGKNGVIDSSNVQELITPSHWPPFGTQSASASPAEGPAPAGTSPLDVSVSLNKSSYALGEQITATVDYTNNSAQPIKVLNLDQLEGTPISFEIVSQGGATADFIGPHVRRAIDYDQDFTTLGPGQSLQRTFDLITAGDGSTLYNLIESGNYELTAVYTGFFGLPRTDSNTVNFTVTPGGAIDGNVTDKTTGLPVDDVVVRALQGTQVRAQTTTDFNGDYSFDELPAGTYTVDAKKLGYLRTTEPNVSVSDGNTTTKDLELAPLVASDGIRLVLTWNGATMDDLDAHLWLPAPTPFHVVYFRRGFLDQCPFANLDIDIISQGGPETMTIGQLYGGGDYLYAVNRFNNSGNADLSATGAQVKLYDADGDLLNTYNVPNTGTEEWWELLEIDGDTGTITPINTLGADPAPYSDTSSGCS